MRTKLWPVGWLVGCLVCLATCNATAADLPRQIELSTDPLEEVLDRIRGHAANDAWQKEGWKDEKIEAWLDKLVASVATGANLPGLQLPVRQADVAPQLDPRQLLRGGALLVGKDVKSMGVSRSIILSDGDVDLTRAEDCVIVARGSVRTQIAKRSVIVAGTSLNLYFDGEPGAVTDGSLLVTRGWADIQSAGYGTTLIALEGSKVGRPQEMVFINAEIPPAQVPFGNRNPGRSVKIADLPLTPLPEHPLCSKIDILGVILGETKKETPPLPGRTALEARGVVFRHGGRRYVADLDEPIVDEAGQPVEALRGWKLQHATESVAVFTLGDTVAMVRRQGD